MGAVLEWTSDQPDSNWFWSGSWLGLNRRRPRSSQTRRGDFVRLSAGGILNSQFLDPILCQFVGRSRNMFALLILTTTASAQDYCAITPKHTACGQKGPGPSCNGGHLARGVTAAEIEEILAVHNRYRALVARGEERRGAPGPQPGAANMRQMVWDAELSVVAQAHADQCKFAHDCSDCRRVSRFGVGQNLYIYKQSLRKPDNNGENNG